MFTRQEARRVKAVAVTVAVATWLSLIAAALLAVLRVHPATMAALVLCVTSWGLALLLAWSLTCPWCCKPLFFLASLSNSPSPSQLLQQVLPYETVVHSRFKCPYCRSRFVLPTA